jgi:hypothetical protein
MKQSASFVESGIEIPPCVFGRAHRKLLINLIEDSKPFMIGSLTGAVAS